MQTTVEIPTSEDTHTIAGLIGTIPEWQFLQLLQMDNLVETRSQAELHTLWEAAANRRASLVTPSSSKIAATYLPRNLAPYEQEIRQRPTFKRYYEGYRFCLVPIQDLVTPQWYINLDYVETLKQHAPRPGSLREALDFACDEGGVTLGDPCTSIFNGLPSLAFQAPAYRDLGTFFAPLRPFEVQRVNPGKFMLNIQAEIEVKANYLSLAKHGTRYIILNGIHRSLALLQVGWEQIPCLVRDAPPTLHSLTELGFQQNCGLLPDDLILRGARPAYLTDYLDPIAAPHFQQKKVNALWQIIPQILSSKQSMPT